MHFTGDVACDTRRSERGCHVDRTSQLPRFLSLLHRKKRDAANLFTFPKCQDKLGGLHVGAQSWRQLFYKRSVWGWTFPFASSVLARRQDGGPHLPGRVRLASPHPALGWTHGRTGPPCGPTEGGAAAGAAGSGDFAPRPRRRPGRERGGGCGPRAGSRSGRTREGGRRGFHPGTRTRTSAFSSPRFLKAKAIIYRPFRFAACSLRELDIQAPPEREGGAGAGGAPAAAEEAVRGGRSRDAPSPAGP